MWRRACSYEVLSVWKDTEYMRWRYDRHPDHTFHYAYLMKGERMVAFTVVHIDENNDAFLQEFLVDRRHVALGRFFLNRLRHHYTGSGHPKLRFIGHDAGFFEAAFGDFNSVVFFPLAFAAKLIVDDPELNQRLQIPSNWKVTYGDLS